MVSASLTKEPVFGRVRHRLILLALTATCVWDGPAFAQIASPPSGPIFQKENPGFNHSIDPSGKMIMRLRDNFGRPCIIIRGFVRRNAVLPDLSEHMIEATNKCPRLITISVCYFNTRACIDLKMNSFATKVAQLGAMKNVYDFRYSFTEKRR